jgi:hypothetical protein
MLWMLLIGDDEYWCHGKREVVPSPFIYPFLCDGFPRSHHFERSSIDILSSSNVRVATALAAVIFVAYIALAY